MLIRESRSLIDVCSTLIFTEKEPPNCSSTKSSMPSTPPPSAPLQFPDHWRIFPGPSGEAERLPTLTPAEGEKTRLLIAEDDPVSREVLALRLNQWGYEVVVTRDGAAALAELRKPDAPMLAILDWMMPEISGVEICRRMREVNKTIYLILLTARNRTEDVVEALQAGADDYLVKPFEKDELHARIRVGQRIIGLQTALAEKVQELEAALGKGAESEIKHDPNAPLV
jgi:CheY-like chemotaxis protein